MTRTAIIIVAISACSCLTWQPPTYTVYGAGVWADAPGAPDKATFRAIADGFADGMARMDIDRARVIDALDGLTVQWHTGHVPVAGGGKAAGTYARWQVDVAVADDPCRSALVHELFHHVRHVVDGLASDYDHTDSRWPAVALVRDATCL